MLDLENQFLALTKGSMLVDEYTKAFTDKMEFAPGLVPDELTNIDRYAKGLRRKYTVLVKHAPTFEATIWDPKYVEGMMKKKFSKSSNKTGSNQERKWCNQ